jgi:tetratricopeptide (TPR) repeat protein
MEFKERNNRVWTHAVMVCFVLICTFVTAAAQAKKPVDTVFRTVSVISEPDAIVWIDGVKYGKTADDGKLTITTVAPGRRVFRIRADGFKEVTKTVLPTQNGNIEILLTKTADQAELAYQQAEAMTTTDRDKAVESYQKAIRLRPQYVQALVGLARVYSEGGQDEKAQSAIKAVRKINPRVAEASVIEGRIFKDGGEDVKAIASFKRAITEASGFQPEAHTGLGLIYKERAENAAANGEYELEDKNYSESARYFSIAVKQLSGAPDSVILYQFLGLVYEQQKKYKEAIAVYQEFLRLFPGHPESATFESYIVQLKKQLNESK